MENLQSSTDFNQNQTLAKVDNDNSEKASLRHVVFDNNIKRFKDKSYIPFRIIVTGSLYNKNREDLDKEILSAITNIRIDSITKTLSQTGTMLEFFRDLDALWIDPYQWNYLAKGIELSENMKFVTLDPLIQIYLKEPKIIKHPYCDVWMCPEDLNINRVLYDLEIIKKKNIFTVPKNGFYKSLYDEVIKAYEYQLFDTCENFLNACPDLNNIYLIGNDVFNKQFFMYALEEIYSGNIPLLSVPFNSDNLPIHQWKASFTDAYIKAISLYAYYTPKSINTLNVSNEDNQTHILHFICSSKKVYIDIMKNKEDPNNYIMTEILDSQILSSRYILSKKDIRSFIVKTNMKTYLCTKEPQEFENIKLETIIDSVIGDSGNIYPLDNYLNSGDTFEKYKLFIGYNSFGYYTYGSLKGLVDNPNYATFINTFDEYVNDSKIGDIGKDSLVSFDLIHVGKNNLNICKLILPNDEYINFIKNKLQNMVKYGYFYSYWSKSYMQTFHEFSNVELRIPDIIKNGDLSIEDSVAACEFIINYK